MLDEQTHRPQNINSILTATVSQPLYFYP